MRKRTIFGIVMLLLVLSTSSMSVVKAATYVWDDVHFVEGYEGEWIKYPHPDRLYYGISPYSTQGIDGNMLLHCQIDSITSVTLVAAADVLCAALGALIGARIGGLYGAVVGALVGGALGVVITYVSEAYFLDEHNCIWWWLTLAFMEWLYVNAFDLWYQSLTDPVGATAMILTMLLAIGYVRVGEVTFLDAIGMGNPAEPVTVTLDISSTPVDSAVWIDGAWRGSTVDDPLTVTVQSGYHSIDVQDVVYVRKRIGPHKWTAKKYVFDYWTISSQPGSRYYYNPIALNVGVDGEHLTAVYYFAGTVTP